MTAGRKRPPFWSTGLPSALFFLGSLIVQAQSPGTFTATGSMATARLFHTATLLMDGRVLIAGGQNGASANRLSSTEIYDPVAKTFTPGPNMTIGRTGHTATLLVDGRVLIVDGEQTPPGANGIEPGGSAELFDPAAGSFTQTGSLLMARQGFNATLLANGKVLVTGGVAGVTDSGYMIGDPEIYDPATGAFTVAGFYAGSLASLNTGGIFGFGSVSALLADGTTLFATEPACQVYDPTTATFSLQGPIYVTWAVPGGSTFTPDYIVEQTASLLLNGRILLAGGENEDTGYYRTAELYEAASGAFIPTGNMLKSRGGHTATVLPDGRVLISGGTTEPCGDNSCWVTGPDASAELYDPAQGVFTDAGNMTTDRDGHTATLLNNGDVLIVGGNSYSGPDPFGGFEEASTASAELYHPSAATSAPALFLLAGAGTGQGIVWHASTGQLASPQKPAVAGETLSMYVTGLAEGGAIPPQLSVGGQMAQVLYFGDAPGYPGYFQVNFLFPASVTPGTGVPVRLTYLFRSSNSITIAAQ
ncbi:MAG: kelch repeat-containing protein [Bryobacteraceae bacterium]|jgi:hypothetical protein